MENEEDLVPHRSHDMHVFMDYAQRCWTCGACDCHNAAELVNRCTGTFEGWKHGAPEQR